MNRLNRDSSVRPVRASPTHSSIMLRLRPCCISTSRLVKMIIVSFLLWTNRNLNTRKLKLITTTPTPNTTHKISLVIQKWWAKSTLLRTMTTTLKKRRRSTLRQPRETHFYSAIIARSDKITQRKNSHQCLVKPSPNQVEEVSVVWWPKCLRMTMRAQTNRIYTSNILSRQCRPFNSSRTTWGLLMRSTFKTSLSICHLQGMTIVSRI